MMLRKLTLFSTALLATGVCGLAHAQPAAPDAKAPAIPQSELSDIATMPAATSRWVYVMANFGEIGARIFDGESGKMKGMIEVPSVANLSLDPQGRYYYVAETMWTKVTRGVRQDMVSIYDVEHLKLLAEVPVPGRLLGGTELNNFVVSTDGKLGFVYNMTPSSSIEVVDLVKRKHQQTVQLPGCAGLFPSGADGVAALCSDGSMATVTFSAAGKATVSKSEPFFPVAKDPVYDQVVVDRAKGVATFVSYTGKVYSATLGAHPQFAAPWSLQTAAGLRDAVAAPLDVNWIPGGRQPYAINRATGRMYVLMHVGELWSQKAAGEEIWTVDLATHKVLARHATPGKVGNIQVSQEATPLVFVSGGPEGKVWILDGETMEEKHNLEHTGGGSLYVVEPS